MALPEPLVAADSVPANLIADYVAEGRLDRRHVGQNLRAIVAEGAPAWRAHSEAVVHWAAYYQLSPLALLAVLEAGQQQGDISPAEVTVDQIKATARALGRDELPLPGMAFGKSVIADARDRLKTHQQRLPAVSKITGGDQPRLVAPIQAERQWYFNGVHTWTGDDNGEPMSSIDLLVDRNHQWGDNTSAIWVAAAHSGTVTRFSECYLLVTHDSGWATEYYHLEGIQVDSGDVVLAGENLANYANDLQTALCDGGHSDLPHVHFALSKDFNRVSLADQVFSEYLVHPGRFSYDSSINFMWLEKDQQRLAAWVDPISRLTATVAIDHHINGMWYQPEFAGHGFNLVVEPLADDSASNVFITFFTYDDDGNANFYTGNTRVAQWLLAEPLAIPMFQTANGGFSDATAIDFDNSADFAPAGNLTLTINDCANGEISVSLLERSGLQTVEHHWPIEKLIGVPVTTCQAAML